MATLLAGLPQSVSGTTLTACVVPGWTHWGLPHGRLSGRWRFADRRWRGVNVTGTVVMGKAASAFSRQAEMFDTTMAGDL